MEHHNSPIDDGRTRTRATIAFVVFLLIGAYFVVTEYWAHIAGIFAYWPYLLALACPLMHVFMHRGHGHPGHRHGAEKR